MPSFTLTPQEAATLLPLPGHALLKCLPAKLTTESGLLHLPEKAAEGEMQRSAVRGGEVIRVSLFRPTDGLISVEKHRTWHLDEDSLAIQLGKTVFYLGHADEVDNEYVIVKLGQIVAIEDVEDVED